MTATLVNESPTKAATAFHLPDVPVQVARNERRGRAALALIVILWAFTGALLIVATVGDPTGSTGTFWFRFDRLFAVLGLLVTTVGGVVTAYGMRYLRGDGRAGRFFMTVPATVAAALVMVSAMNLVAFAIGWTLSEIGVVLLVGMYRPEAQAVRATRATIRAFVFGDAALWASVVVVCVTWGNLDFHAMLLRPPVVAGHTASEVLLAVLVPVAVAARCALLPFARWLPSTLAAPTPVSAFLHAGLVNAGGFLLVRIAPLFGQLRLGEWIVFLVGGVTVVMATAAMNVEPTVKGSLVRSTSAQMGFMVACCGLGWYTAAVLHLVAHGLYKATLFLGSGSAVLQHAEGRRTPPSVASSRRLLQAVSILAPGVAIIWAMLFIGPVAGRDQLWGIAVLGWATASRMAWGWTRRLSTSGTAIAVIAGLSAASSGYVFLAWALGRFLSPSIAGVSGTVVPVAAGAVVVALLAALTVVSRLPQLAGYRFVHGLWVWSVWFGRPPLVPICQVRPARTANAPLVLADSGPVAA